MTRAAEWLKIKADPERHAKVLAERRRYYYARKKRAKADPVAAERWREVRYRAAKKYRLANPETNQANVKRWRKKNEKTVKKYWKRWCRMNPGYFTVAARAERKARRLAKEANND